MIKIMMAATTAAVLSVGAAIAGTVPFTVLGVHAHGSGAGTGLNTGISYTVGETFIVTVDDPADSWNFGPGANFETTADGAFVIPRAPVTYTFGGFSAPRGTLVGRVNGGNFFSIGTSGAIQTADTSGVLELFMWERDLQDNSGDIAVGVSAVPLPLGLPMLGGALLGGAAFLRKRKKS